ncbi:hypothetical protein ACFZCG_39755 [Streptomyces tanashiensis]|uniref:hypothetical protein n=1 Tax=Streptomyces tanashiensis TaxID=67367 RepID=UPI0036EBC409
MNASGRHSRSVARNGTGRLCGSGSWNAMNVLVRHGDFRRDGCEDAIARERATGKLWLHTGTGSGSLGARKLIGTGGWNTMDHILGVGDASGDGTTRPSSLAAALTDIADDASRDDAPAALLAAQIPDEQQGDAPWCCRGHLDPDMAIGLLATIYECQGRIDARHHPAAHPGQQLARQPGSAARSAGPAGLDRGTACVRGERAARACRSASG